MWNCNKSIMQWWWRILLLQMCLLWNESPVGSLHSIAQCVLVTTCTYCPFNNYHIWLRMSLQGKAPRLHFSCESLKAKCITSTYVGRVIVLISNSIYLSVFLTQPSVLFTRDVVIYSGRRVFKCKVKWEGKQQDILDALRDQHHFRTKGLILKAKTGGLLMMLININISKYITSEDRWATHHFHLSELHQLYNLSTDEPRLETNTACVYTLHIASMSYVV